jgi:protein ImuB
LSSTGFSHYTLAFCAIFVPQFLLQAVERSEPGLRNQSLVLLDGPAPTFRVIAVSEAARLSGVTPGLSKAAAAEFPGVQMRFRSKEQEAAAHAALLDAAWSVSPRVENTALDILVVDLAGLTALFGCHEEIARQIQVRCFELGLTVHAAVSENVETARILACAQPGPTIVPAGQEAFFLKSLPVGLLAPSVEFAEVLHHWGITACGALAALPVLSLSECAGQEGVRLHAVANGKGDRSLILSEPAHIFEETLELDDAVEELEPLSFLLGRLLDQLCARLAARALAVRVIRLQCELQPAFENAVDSSREILRIQQLPGVFHCSLTLPRPVQDAKLLLKLLRLRLQDKPPNAPVQKLSMRAEPDRPVAVQGGLFLPAAPDPDRLELTLARVASVVGETNVGAAEPLDSYRPDAFRMRKFWPPAVADVRHAGTLVFTESRQEQGISFRHFRPPLPAYVVFDGGWPVKAGWKKNTGKVVHASGPWRISGNWWEENSWQEDAWEVELQFTGETAPASGVYCLVFDALQKKWFVRGRYD